MPQGRLVGVGCQKMIAGRRNRCEVHSLISYVQIQSAYEMTATQISAIPSTVNSVVVRFAVVVLGGNGN